MTRSNALALALIFTLAACSDDGTAETTDSDASETTSDTDTDSATETTDTDDTDTDDPMAIDCEVDAWDIAADTEWKSAWMAACMVPAVAPIMQGIDADKYADFSCAACHGDDLGGGTFAMPAAIELDWAEAAMWPPEYYDGATFMGPMSDVVAAAADALGVEPFDPMTMTGFGCGGCHVGL